jgi:hypothetical protein
VILPGKASVEVNSEIFDRLDLGNVCLVDVHWGTLTSSHVNVMWDDLDSLILSFHFRVQLLISSKCSCRFAEVCVGSGLVVNMAVSSAKVLRIVLSGCGRSAVYNVYNNGPRMLPWGTPESIGSEDDVLLLSEIVKYLSLFHRAYFTYRLLI